MNWISKDGGLSYKPFSINLSKKKENKRLKLNFLKKKFFLKKKEKNLKIIKKN